MLADPTLPTEWSPVNHRSGTGKEKSANQRPTSWRLSHAANIPLVANSYSSAVGLRIARLLSVSEKTAECLSAVVKPHRGRHWWRSVCPRAGFCVCWTIYEVTMSARSASELRHANRTLLHLRSLMQERSTRSRSSGMYVAVIFFSLLQNYRTATYTQTNIQRLRIMHVTQFKWHRSFCVPHYVILNVVL